MLQKYKINLINNIRIKEKYSTDNTRLKNKKKRQAEGNKNCLHSLFKILYTHSFMM